MGSARRLQSGSPAHFCRQHHRFTTGLHRKRRPFQNLAGQFQRASQQFVRLGQPVHQPDFIGTLGAERLSS